MQHSSPVPADDQRGHRITGAAVVLALVLLVLGGAGLSIAMYFLLPPGPSARPEANAPADRAANTVSDSRQAWPPATKGPPSPPTAERPADGRTALPTPAVESLPTVGSQGPPLEAGEVPVRSRQSPETPEKSRPSGFDVTTLPPIEVQADDASRETWRRSVEIGGQRYERAVCLRPAEDRGVVLIAFDIDTRFARLRGVAGIADSRPSGPLGTAQDRPQAVFRVYGDGNLLWESGPLTGRGEQRAFECSVAGVDVLTFVAESQSPANVSDLAWSDLTLLSGTEPHGRQIPDRPKTP